MRYVPKSSIGVLIADDSATICKLIVQLMQRERSMHIVGVAGTLDETLHLAVEYTPDVLLLDLHLDDLVGHDPLRVKIGLLSCVRHIVAMSTRTDEQERQLALGYGAGRLIDKFFLSEQLVASILACGYGKRPLLPPRQRHHQPQNRIAS
jgi:two-component system, cell cycle response regulator CtrA